MTREPDLVPIRHGRMLVSPFTFYRGAAKVMAADLRHTPTAGLTTQLCGDAHLSNFGMFASPERVLLLDLNDFDETLPGPFEYDVKRLATSFTIAARNNGFTESEARDVDPGCGPRVPGGDGRIRRDADAGCLVRTSFRGRAQEGARPGGEAATRQGHQEGDAGRQEGGREKHAEGENPRQPPRALEVGEYVDGSYRIVSQPPAVVPAREIARLMGISADEVQSRIRKQFDDYRSTLPDDRRQLLDRFEIVDVARKVVGVGSVGTRALHRAPDGARPARPALPPGQGGHPVSPRGPPAREPLPPTRRAGRAGPADDAGRERHLPRLGARARDRPALLLAPAARHEGLSDVESMLPAVLTLYARQCGWTLARAHARSGDPIAISSYLGRATTSTPPLRTSHEATPTRTSRTSRRSPTRSASGASTPFTMCEPVGDDGTPYLLTNAELETAERFAGLEAVFDPVTRGHLTRLGLAPGSRCLEVGAGSGSIARWMADQVGSTGRVLAVDLDPRWCRREGRAQLEVRDLDLVRSPSRSAHGMSSTSGWCFSTSPSDWTCSLA